MIAQMEKWTQATKARNKKKNSSSQRFNNEVKRGLCVFFAWRNEKKKKNY